MKKTVVFVVFHTTETGADYAVGRGFKTRQLAQDWEFENRGNYSRPLFIRKVEY